MPKITVHQKGFATIEAVLIFIIVAIIGGTGYFVYHANKKTDDYTLNSSAKSGSYKKATGGKGGETGDSHAQTGPAAQEVYLIPEWKLQSLFPTPPEIAGLIQYKIDANQTAANFTTQELLDVNTACTADQAPAGSINRALSNDPYVFSDGSDSGKTVAQEFATAPIKPYKVIADTYYWYTGPQGACDSTAKGAQLQAAAVVQVKAIVNHLEKAQ